MRKTCEAFPDCDCDKNDPICARPLPSHPLIVEEVEAILYKHTFDELEDDQYVFLRKGIFEAAKEIAATSFLPAQMKELREIGDSHAIEVCYIMQPELREERDRWRVSKIGYGIHGNIHETIFCVAWEYKNYKGDWRPTYLVQIDNEDCDLILGVWDGEQYQDGFADNVVQCIDYLRQFYHIPNAYSVPAAVSAEEVSEAAKEYYEMNEDAMNLAPRDIESVCTISFIDGANWQAAHPLSAPKRDEVEQAKEALRLILAHDAGFAEYNMQHNYREMYGLWQNIKNATIKAHDSLCSISLPSSVPAIDWERVEADIYKWANTGTTIHEIVEFIKNHLRSDIKKETK